jgi:lipopolysaccharide/colanic/teichoic acid biosynthesis glycosyltransferase
MTRLWGTPLLDRCVAGLVLAGAAPLILAIALANRLLTGRVLFRQARVGRGLRPFALLKFQTMVDGAEAGSTVTAAGDRRITPFGRTLRRLKLDELPQLVNVLRGEMRLVGPRPLTPNEVSAIPQDVAAAVYRAAPGMTGISAVAFADEERLLAGADDPERVYFDQILPRKVALELAYARRRTWMTDLLVLLVSPVASWLPGTRRRVLERVLPEDAGLTATEGSPGPVRPGRHAGRPEG